MTQTDKPSVEEMNFAIAKYMSIGTATYDEPIGEVWESDFLFIGGRSIKDSLRFHISWDWLHGAWDKVYAEYCKITEHLKERRFYFDYITTMSNAMITGNITTAHKILYDAILWIKNNEETIG